MMHNRRLVSSVSLLIVLTAFPAMAQYGRRGGGGMGRRDIQGGPVDAPLATFPGTVRGLDAKLLTIEGPDGNTLMFHCSRKTKFYDGSKEIKREAIKAGDRVSVEGHRAGDGTMDAVNIRMDHGKPAEPTPAERSETAR